MGVDEKDVAGLIRELRDVHRMNEALHREANLNAGEIRRLKAELEEAQQRIAELEAELRDKALLLKGYATLDAGRAEAEQHGFDRGVEAASTLLMERAKRDPEWASFLEGLACAIRQLAKPPEQQGETDGGAQQGEKA